LTTQHSPTVTSVRGRLDQQRAAEELKSEPQAQRSALAEHYLAEYKKDESAKKQRELDEQRRNLDAIARQKELTAQNLRAFQINLMFNSAPGGPATPAERKRILSLPAAKDASPDTILSMLVVLRDTVGNRPDWAK
jgi:hypothetical protein